MYNINMSDQNNQDFNLNSNTLNDAWQSEYYRNLRQDFLDGKMPEGCTRCWSEEASGKVSKRIRDNARFKHHITQDIIDNPKIKYLDLKLGNICNLKCRICGTHSSSKWIAEQQHYDKEDKHEETHIRHSWPETNKEFWQQLEELLPTLEYIDFTGGEPFMIKDQFELLKFCVDKGYAKHIGVHYNTNGTQLPNEALEDIWPHFKTVDVQFSIDGIGEQFEYQRHPAKWNKALEVLQAFKDKQSKKFTVGVCHTINIFNVMYVPEFLKWADEFGISVYLNSLHYPNYYNIKCLPYYAKRKISEKLNTHPNPNVKTFIDYMNQDDDGYWDWMKFVTWTVRKDQFRKEKFTDTFPELAEICEYDKYVKEVQR
tara:strand:+ start:22857 stop:23966 length:1110 start_codon:yes stop_codon:yes gene_type:complete